MCNLGSITYANLVCPSCGLCRHSYIDDGSDKLTTTVICLVCDK